MARTPARRLIPGLVVTFIAAQIASALADPRISRFDASDLFTAVTLAGFVVLAVSLSRRTALVCVVALIVVWLAGYAAFADVGDLVDAPIPTEQAVGSAAYFLSPYLGEQLVGAGLIALVLLVGMLVAWRRGSTSEPTGAPAPAGDRALRRLLVVLAGLVVLTLVPDLHDQLVVQSRGPLAAGWDQANLITWAYLQQQGFAPMADYWYPYGNAWVFTDFPTGPVAMLVWQASLVCAVAWALWRLLGPRPYRIGLCLLGLAVLGGFDPHGILGPPLFWRYVAGLVVALAYAAVGPLRHVSPTRGHAVFFALSALVALLIPDMLVVGLGGALFVALGALTFEPSVRAPRRLVRAAAVDVLPVVGALAVMLVAWALAGTFDENLRWFGEVRAGSAFTAIQHPASALAGLNVEPGLTPLLLVVSPLLLVFGFAYGRARDDDAARTVSLIMFAASGATAVVLAKHLVRPQSVLVLHVPLTALLWSATVLWSRRSVTSWIAVGVFLGALAATLDAASSVPPARYLTAAVNAPATVVRDLEQVVNRKELREAAGDRFAAERFADDPVKQFVADKVAAQLGGPGARRFAVLGDAPLLYVLLGQPPPDHVEMYTMSPIENQRDVVAALRRSAPEHLVWRRDYATDGVPYHVRDPLVFAYAIDRYVPETRSEPWDLLRRRKPGEPVALGYWRRRLGTTVDLAGIPSYSRGDERARCRSGSDCAPYAIVTGPGRGDGAPVSIRLAGTPYALKLATRKGVNTYAVRLDRLWYWPYVGAGTRLVSATPGWQVQRVGARAGDALY